MGKYSSSITHKMKNIDKGIFTHASVSPSKVSRLLPRSEHGLMRLSQPPHCAGGVLWPQLPMCGKMYLLSFLVWTVRNQCHIIYFSPCLHTNEAHLPTTLGLLLADTLTTILRTAADRGWCGCGGGRGCCCCCGGGGSPSFLFLFFLAIFRFLPYIALFCATIFVSIF